MEKFDVLFSSDSKYIDIMLASIYSFLINSNLDNIRIHIIASNFSLEDYQKIETVINTFSNVELYFYPFEHFNIEKYQVPNWRGSQISNARLFFEDILKPHKLNIKNLLYLDSDTITLSSLKELSNYKNELYAVKDACLNHYYHSLSNLKAYFNSGVIFINVDEWTKNAYQEVIIKTLKENNIKFTFPDQDLFNCSLSNYIKELPINYNIPPYAYFFNDLGNNLYFNNKNRNISSEEIRIAKENPKIIHSYGLSGIKPWDSTFNPFHEEYMKYLLKVNPNFQANDLKTLKKILSNNPNLYKAMLITRTYLPEKLENHVKKLALKCHQNNNNKTK